MENSHQVSTSTPAKRKKVQNVNVLTSPVKVKVEDNDDGWNQMVPQQPSCSDQPGTGCSVFPMTVAKEDSLLEDVPDGNSGLHKSDSNVLCLDNFEEDSTDEESMWHFGDCSAMENANVVKYLCKVLDIDLVKKPRLILSQASLESFISLQPLLAEKLLTKRSAQTLATHNISLSELCSCYQHNPEKGLQKVCCLINARWHGSKKEVRNLSKVKVYFQHQEQRAESQKTLTCSNFPRAIKSEEKC